MIQRTDRRVSCTLRFRRWAVVLLLITSGCTDLETQPVASNAAPAGPGYPTPQPQAAPQMHPLRALFASTIAAVLQTASGGIAAGITGGIVNWFAAKTGATASAYPGAVAGGYGYGGTSQYGSSSYPNSGYPSASYPSSGYPSTGYPSSSSSYPSSSYPSSGTTAGSTYPSTGYPSQQQPYPTTTYPDSTYPNSNGYPGANTYPNSTYPSTGNYPSVAAQYPNSAATMQYPNPTQYPNSGYPSSTPYPGSTYPSSGAQATYGSNSAPAYGSANTQGMVAPATAYANTRDSGIYAGIAYEVHALSADGHWTPVDPDTYQFRSGDRFMVYYRPALPGRMQVLNINPAGQQTLIDAADMAAGQLAGLGPYEFTSLTGEESLRLILTPCSTPQLLVATRDIVKAGAPPPTDAQTGGGVQLEHCSVTATRGVDAKTRDISKVAADGTTVFALDPVSQQEASSGAVDAREVTIAFHHR